jgi:hypothetical protein
MTDSDAISAERERKLRAMEQREVKYLRLLRVANVLADQPINKVVEMTI